LWSIGLDGTRQVVWKHPRADVLDIGVAPGGAQVAMSVSLAATQPSDASAVLYLLEKEGPVRVLDVARNFETIEALTFLRPPDQAKSPKPVLYWLRFNEQIEPRTGRGKSQIMHLMPSGDVGFVKIPLRYDESGRDHVFPDSPSPNRGADRL
jgi:hypothetical protein